MENIQKKPRGNRPGSRLRKRRENIEEWKEPNRHGRGPTMTTEAVAKRLTLTPQRIKDLTIIGPEEDGLAGYVNLGEKWERKRGKGPGGIQIFYYASDIEAWDKNHPLREERPIISYTEQEKNIVIGEAEKIKNEKGQVNRRNLFPRLRYIPETIRHAKSRYTGVPRTDEGYGPLHWNDRTWGRMKQILDDAGIPGSPAGRKRKAI